MEDKSFWSQLAKNVPAPTQRMIDKQNEIREAEEDITDKDLKDMGISKKELDKVPVKKNMTEAEEKAALKELEKDAKYYNYDDTSFGSEDLAVGGYNTLNSALFGIPDVIVKASSTDAYKKLQALRERNKKASAIGDIAGVFVPTPGMALTAAGKAGKAASVGMKAGKGAERAAKFAKAADTGADFMKATGKFADVRGVKGVTQAAGRGAIESGLQVAPRYLSGETDEKGALTGLALGTGIGAASKAVPNVLRTAGFVNKGEKFTDPLQDILVDKELAARGISGRDIRIAMNKTASNLGIDKTGNIVNNADEVKRSVLALLKKNDILNPDEARDFIQGAGKKFEKLNDLFDKSGMKISDFAADIYDDPAITQFIADHGDAGRKMVDDMIEKYSGKGGLSNIKTSITKDIAFANKSTDRLVSDSGDVAIAIKNKLDDAVLELDPDYASYKADWKAIQPLRTMVARDKVTIGKASAGSDTAAKMATTTILGGGTGLASAIEGYDPKDPNSLSDAAAKVIGGLVIGSFLNRSMPGVTNYTVGQVSSAVNNPKVLKVLEKAGYVLSKADIDKALERLAAQAATEETPGSTREKMGEIQSPEEILKAKKRSEGGFFNTEEVAPTEEFVSTDNIEEVENKRKAEYGKEYMDALEQKMINYWYNNFSDQIDYEDYKKLVAEKTDNFSPEKTASFLYPDKKERGAFIRDLNITNKLSKINLDEIYKKPGFLADKSERALLNKQQADLVDTISLLVTDPGNVPSKATTDIIKADIAAIANLKASPEEKRQLLFNLLSSKYSLGLNNLRQLGLA